MLKSMQVKFRDATQEELRLEFRYRVDMLYRDLVWVLRAQGGFTPEKKKLMKHVKEYFLISDYKHRLECRIAAMHADLDLIACSVAGPHTNLSWYREAMMPHLLPPQRGIIDVNSYLYKMTEAVSEADEYFSETNKRELTSVVKLEKSEYKKYMKDRREHQARCDPKFLEPQRPLDKNALHITIIVQEDKEDAEIEKEENDSTTVTQSCKRILRSTRKNVPATTRGTKESFKESTDTDKVLMPPPPPPTTKPLSPHSPNVSKSIAFSSAVSIASSSKCKTSLSFVSNSSPVKTSTPLLNVSPLTPLPTSQSPPLLSPSCMKNMSSPVQASLPLINCQKKIQPTTSTLINIPSFAQTTSIAKEASTVQSSSMRKVPTLETASVTKNLSSVQPPSISKVSTSAQPPIMTKVPVSAQPLVNEKVSSIGKNPSSIQPSSIANLPLPAQPPSVVKVPSSPAQPLSIPNIQSSAQSSSITNIQSSSQHQSIAQVPSSVQSLSTTKVQSSAQPPSIAKTQSSAQPPSIAKTQSSTQPSSIVKTQPSAQPPSIPKTQSSAQPPSIPKIQSSSQPPSIPKTQSSPQPPSIAQVLPSVQSSSITSSITKVQPSPHLPSAKVQSSEQPPSISNACLPSDTIHSTPVSRKNVASPTLQVPIVDLTHSPEASTSFLSSAPVSSSLAAISTNLTIPVSQLASVPEPITPLTNITQTVQVSDKPLMSSFEVPSSQPVGLPHTVVQPADSLSESKDIQFLSFSDSLESLPPLVIVPPPEPVITVPHSSSFAEPVQASTFILPPRMSYQPNNENVETKKRKRTISESGGAVVNTATAPKTLALTQLSKLTPVMVNATTVNSQGQMKISAISRITTSTQPTLSTSLASSAQKVIIVTNSAARATLNMRPGNGPVNSVNLPVVQKSGPRPQFVQSGGGPGVAKPRPKVMPVQAKSQRPNMPSKPDNITAVSSASIVQTLPRPLSPANILPKPPGQAGNVLYVNPVQGTAQKVGNTPPGYRLVHRGSAPEGLTTKSQNAGLKQNVGVVQKPGTKPQAVKMANSNPESVKKLISNKFVVIQNPKRRAKSPAKPPPPVKETPKTVVPKKSPSPIAKAQGNNVVVLNLTEDELNQNLGATIAEILQASGIITSSSNNSQVTLSHPVAVSSSRSTDPVTSQVLKTKSSPVEVAQNSAEVAEEGPSLFTPHSDSAVAVQHSIIDMPTNMCLEEYSSQQHL